VTGTPDLLAGHGRKEIDRPGHIPKMLLGRILDGRSPIRRRAVAIPPYIASRQCGLVTTDGTCTPYDTRTITFRAVDLAMKTGRYRRSPLLSRPAGGNRAELLKANVGCNKKYNNHAELSIDRSEITQVSWGSGTLLRTTWRNLLGTSVIPWMPSCIALKARPDAAHHGAQGTHRVSTVL
jgi:hypothetical protein